MTELDDWRVIVGTIPAVIAIEAINYTVENWDTTKVVGGVIGFTLGSLVYVVRKII